MFLPRQLTRIVFTITAVLSLSACASNAQRLAPSSTLTKGPAVTSPADDQDDASRPTLYPVLTPFRFPEKDILPPPTLTTTETFDCWVAPSPRISPRQDSLGQLLVVYRVDRAPTWASNLYRFDLATQKYSLLVSQIESYEPSLDGLKMWYGFNKSGNGDVIFVHDLATDTRRQVPFPISIDSRIERIAWSPDSQCLFAWRDDTAFAYRLKDGALQSKAFPGVNFGFNPRAVSPDGRWWAWNCEKNFCLMSPQGQRIDHLGLHLPVTTESGSGFSVRSLGWWSPDSRMLAILYPGHRSDYQDAIRVIYVNKQGVSSFQDVDLKEPMIIQGLLWSPDSRQLLFLNGAAKLYIYRPEAQEVVTVPTPDGNYFRAAAWSPNGQQIAVVTMDKQYKVSLYVMNADGKNASPIPPLPQETEGAEMVAPNYAIDQVYWIP